MKLNRSQMIAVLMVVLAIFTGILLSSCASIGKGKEAAVEEEIPERKENQSTAVKEKSGGIAEAPQEHVVKAGGFEVKPHIQEASLKAEDERIQQYAASVRQALDHIFPETLSEMNWNRIATVLVGILMMSMIYGLAFALARLPLRKGGGRPSRAG